MANGYERRDQVKDPNAQGDASRPASVPLSPVMAPRPSSFSKVGESERQLAEALGKAPIGLSKYLDKKQEEWQLEGQMAYAEGKTEAEIAQSGNRYTMAGFMSMKARTAGNEWMQQALQDIDNGDKMLDSGQYQSKLKDQYKQLTQNIAGQDAYTRNLMASMAGEMFPKLVSQQVVSNNAWREDETANSYTSMLVSEASANGNPDDLLELLDPKVSGLPKSRHLEAVTDAIDLSLKNDNGRLLDLMGFSTGEKMSSLENEVGLPAGLLNAVIHQESRGNRNAVGPLVPGQGTAKSEMQVMDATNYDPGFGVTPAQNDSLEERARVGRDYLSAMYDRYNGDLEATLVAYNAGPGNADKFVAAGKDYNVLPKKSETQPYVKNILSDIEDNTGVAPKRNSATAAMLKIGFTPAQVSKLSSAYESYTSRKSQEFNKDRELWERNLEKDVEVYGNLPDALDKIGMKMNEEGYNDAWASGVTSKVMSAMNAYEKEHRKALRLENANATTSVATLPKADAQKAIDIERARIIAQAKARADLSQDERGVAIREAFSTYLIQNNVVDAAWKSTMSVSLSNILDADGVPKAEALHAFDDYVLLAEKANDGYAAKYLDERSKNLVALARSLTYGKYIDTSSALYYAEQALRRQEHGEALPAPVSDADLEDGIDDVLDTVDSGWFGWRNDKTRGFEVFDSELAVAKTSPVLRTALRHYARNAMLLNPALTPKAAMQRAVADVQGRVEYAMGNVVIGKDTRTIREAMGIADRTDPKTVDKIILDYLREKGPEHFGPAFNEFAISTEQSRERAMDRMGAILKTTTAIGTAGGAAVGSIVPGAGTVGGGLTGGGMGLGVGALIAAPVGAGTALEADVIGHSIAEYGRGVPSMFIQYDSDREVWIIDRWVDPHKTTLSHTPMVVPARELGLWARESENGTLNPRNQAGVLDPRPDWMRKAKHNEDR